MERTQSAGPAVAVHFVFAESSLHKILGVLSLNAPHWTSFKFGVSLETLMEIDKVKHK